MPLAPASALQRPEKGDQVFLLLARQIELEAGVVEGYNLRERRCRPVVEVWGARRQATQDRALEPADIGALAGDEGAARVGRLHNGPRSQAPQCEKRQV